MANRENLNGKTNKYLMHEAAKIALKKLNKESTYRELYDYIVKYNLFIFGAKKDTAPYVLKRILERKCINAKSSSKTKEVIFYKKGMNKFGLLEWLEENKDKKEDKKEEGKEDKKEEGKEDKKEEGKEEVKEDKKEELKEDKDDVRNIPRIITKYVIIPISIFGFLYILYKIITSTTVGVSILITLTSCVIVFLSILYYEVIRGNNIDFKLNELHIISIISAIWTFIILLISSLQGSEQIPINNWGDFLAGFFAPLLLLWLVYGVFIQKKEFSNALESFNMQHKEYIKTTSAMEDQVVQVEIQQLNTWFNRNSNTMNNLKKLIINSSTENTNSIQQIYDNLYNDISKEKTYFELFDELKNIIDLDSYINKYLTNITLNNATKGNLLSSNEEIKEEYNVLFNVDISYCKKILKIVYILIFSSNTLPEYKKYSVYKHWILDEEEIKNILLIYSKGNFQNTIQNIIKNLDKIDINFDKD